MSEFDPWPGETLPVPVVVGAPEDVEVVVAVLDDVEVVDGLDEIADEVVVEDDQEVVGIVVIGLVVDSLVSWGSLGPPTRFLRFFLEVFLPVE
jgi:hypothetical protein